MSNPINVLAPSIPTGVASNLAITAAASTATDLAVTNGATAVRMFAVTATVYVVFGATSTITDPTTSTGFPIAPGTYQDFQVKKGWHFKAIGSGNGDLRYFLYPI
jgi:hypothetical protein